MWPLIDVVIEARPPLARDQLKGVLAELAAEDPLFAFRICGVSGPIVMSGVSESHLDSKADRLLKDYNMPVEFGAPRVACRETLGRRATTEYVHKKSLGPMGQFGAVKISRSASLAMPRSRT
jgi:elongation factor G